MARLIPSRTACESKYNPFQFTRVAPDPDDTQHSSKAKQNTRATTQQQCSRVINDDSLVCVVCRIRAHSENPIRIGNI